jgi:UMF1 family MFS transporter
VTFNLSVVFVTFSFGIINQVSGSMRYSALALGVYFIIGMIFLLMVKANDIKRPN